MVFYEYEKFYRVCIWVVGNFIEYFIVWNMSIGCKFMVVDVVNGMGNKIFIMVLVVFYFILM